MSYNTVTVASSGASATLIASMVHPWWWDSKIRYTIELEKDEDGWYIAKCPEIKGALSQGKTIKSARRNLLEAIELVEKVEAEDAKKKMGKVKKKK